MSQSALGSFVEVITSTAIGLATAFAINHMLYAATNVHVTHAQNLLYVSVFTAFSIIRSYLIRRLFNKVEQWKTVSFKVRWLLWTTECRRDILSFCKHLKVTFR